MPGPGDRRDEDLYAIANAVAGRFDHYICRRDDNLRDRAADEVPRIQAAALRGGGVARIAISVIPDEQEAIDAALNMGQSGDLLLIFADALARSWKQITKFRPAGAPELPPRPRRGARTHAGARGTAGRATSTIHQHSKDCCVTNAASVSRRRSKTERSQRTAVRRLAAPDGQQPILRFRPARCWKRWA